ncbi:MAG: gliding motility-associated C-terminal domain-containing protein [Bacteroidota bacterium]
MLISQLVPGQVYHLMIDGRAGDVCDYAFEVISGISVVPPEINELSPGYIDGPEELCLGDEAVYTIVPPEYEIINDDGCPLPSGACGNGTDSLGFNLVWHVPPFLQIQGDSINVFSINTETPALNDSIISELLGFDITDTFGTFIDTIYGQVYVTYELDTTMMDSTGVDTIPQTVFCSCTGGASSFIGAKDVYFIINITHNPPISFCEGDCVNFCGVEYCDDAVVYCEDGEDCAWVRQAINKIDLFIFSEVVTICEGEFYEVNGEIFNTTGNYFIYDEENCIGTSLDLTVLEIVQTEFNVEICEGECFDFCGQEYCLSGIYECTFPAPDCRVDILNLIVLPSPFEDLGVIALCQDSCFQIENQLFCEAGNYQVTTTGNQCFGTAIFEIVIEPTVALQLGPIIRTCDATNDNYTVSFDMLSGTPPYLVNGVTISGSSFISPPIPHGESYNFEIKDSDPCVAKVFVDGSFDCGPFCNTGAGEMSMEELPTCYEESLLATHLGGAIFNVGDTAEYILHTESGLSLGTIIDRNSTGEFSFIPGVMEYGEVYYASYVVGQNLNGKVDTGHICTVVAPGQPLVFYEPASVEIQSANGEEEQIIPFGRRETLRATANFSPSQVTWIDPQGAVLESSGLSVEIQPLNGGVYTVTAENEVGCEASDELLVTVLLNPHVFIPNAFTPNSDGNNDTFFIYADDAVDQIYSLQIFNRYGAVVFSRIGFAPNDPTLGWDGRFNGQPAPSDVFVYQAEVLMANGEREVLSGDVVLIR